jgi:hypothetical protein
MPTQSFSGRYDQATNASRNSLFPDASSSDGYIAQFSLSNAFVWGTHYGGHGGIAGMTPNSWEHITTIALGGSPNVDVYISGRTSCHHTPVEDPGPPAYFQGAFTRPGGVDNFIARLGNVSSVGISKVSVSRQASSELSATPNPSSGAYTLTFKSAVHLNKSLEVRVINSLGQTVSSRIVKIQGASAKFAIDLSKLPAGTYIATVLGDDPVSARLVKE